MPGISAPHSPVARNPRAPGISMSVTTSEQSVAPGSPSDSTENDEPVWQAASAEAIFIGCCSYMSLPCSRPSQLYRECRDCDDCTEAQRPDPCAVVGLVAPGDRRCRSDDDTAVGAHCVDAVIAPLPQVVPADADQEHARDDQRTEDRVGERGERGAVGAYCPDVVHDGPAVDHLDADRVLHPRVRDDDEVRREPRADHRAPERRKVQTLSQATPSEDPDSQERRLGEECKQALEGRGAPKTSPTKREYSLQAIPN